MSSTETGIEKRMKNLKEPWKKGQTGNPAGRKVGQRPFAVIYREALIKIGESQNMTPEEIENLLVQSGMKNALKGDYRFYQDVMDRTHGKPKQGMELTGKDGGPIEISSADKAINEIDSAMKK